MFRDFLIQKDSCPLSQMMDLTKRMMRRQLKEKKEGEVLRRLWSLNCISRGEESEMNPFELMLNGIKWYMDVHHHDDHFLVSL